MALERSLLSTSSILTRWKMNRYAHKRGCQALWHHGSFSDKEKYMRFIPYDHQPGKDYCEQIGLPYWDEIFANRIDALVRERDLSQDDWDLMVREYAWEIKCMSTPSSYSIWQRIKIACYFLNPFSKG